MQWQFLTQQILAIATMVPECEGVVIDTEVYAGPLAIYSYYGANPVNVDYAAPCFEPFARRHQLNPSTPPGSALSAAA